MSEIQKSVFLKQNQHLFGWREAGLLSFPIIHLLPKNPFTHLDLPPFPQSLWDHHPHKHRFTHPDQSHDTTHGLLFAGVKAGGYLEDLGIDTSMDVSPTLRSVYIHSPYLSVPQRVPLCEEKTAKSWPALVLLFFHLHTYSLISAFPLSVFPFSGWNGWWRCYGRKWALAASEKSSDWLAVGRPEQTATSGDQAEAFNSEQTAEAWPGQTQAGSGVLSLSPVLIPAHAQKRHRKCLTTFSPQSPMKLLLPVVFPTNPKVFFLLLSVDFYLRCDVKSG